MKNKKVITAGIIIIGNEVLSGRTKDINTSTLAKWLNLLGIEVKESRAIPDDESIIIKTVNNLLSASKAINFYKNKAINKYVSFLSGQKCIINKEILSEEAEEIIFKSFSDVLSLI